MPASDARRLSDYMVQVVSLWKESLDLVRRIEDRVGPNPDIQPGFLGLTLWSLQKLDESLQISVKLVPDRYELGVRIFGAGFADGDNLARSQFDDVFLNLQLKVIVPLRLARVDNIEFDCLSLLKHSEDIRVDALGALDALARRTQYFVSVGTGVEDTPSSSSTGAAAAATAAKKPPTSRPPFAVSKDIPTKELPETPVTPQWYPNKNEAGTHANGVGSPMSSVPSSLASTPWSATFGPIEPPRQPLPPTPVSPNKKCAYPRHYQLTRTRASSKVSLSQQSHLSQVSNISDVHHDYRKQKTEGFTSIMEAVDTITPPPLLSPIQTSGTFILDSDNSDSDQEKIKSVPQLPPINTGDLDLPKHYMQAASPTSTRPSSRDTDVRANGTPRRRQKSRPVGYVSPSGSSTLDISKFMSRESAPITAGRDANDTSDHEVLSDSYLTNAPRFRRPSAASSGNGSITQHHRQHPKAFNESMKPSNGCRQDSSRNRDRMRESQHQDQLPPSLYRTQSQGYSRHPSEDQSTGAAALAEAIKIHNRRISRGTFAEPTPEDPFQSPSTVHGRNMSKISNSHTGTPLDDYRLTIPDDDGHNPKSPGRHTRKPSEDSRIAPSDLGASPARSHGGHHTRLPTHIKDDQHRLPRSSIDYLSLPAGDSRRPSDTSDINNTALPSEVHGLFTDIHNEFDVGNGRRPSEFSDSFSTSTDRSENDGHKHRKKFWRLGRRNDSDRIERSTVFTKNDNRTVTTIATHRTKDTAYRSTNGTTTTAAATAAAAAAAAAFPNEDLFLPNRTNDFAGFCKGAWKLQTNQRKAFRLETRPSGMYSQIEYWRCTKCDFEGSVNNPENIAVLSNSAMLHPSPPPDVTPFERTVPNNGKLKHHFDQTIYSHPCGVRYRWAFLAKSHICKKGDRWKGVTAKEAYACIFCCIANRAIPPVFDDLDMFIRHVRRHDGNVAEGHVEEPSPQALRHTKTIVGRVAGYDEEFDLNIAPRQKRESRNIRPSLESPSMRSWVAGSKGLRSQTSHS